MSRIPVFTCSTPDVSPQGYIIKDNDVDLKLKILDAKKVERDDASQQLPLGNYKIGTNKDGLVTDAEELSSKSIDIEYIKETKSLKISLFA